MFDVFEKDHAPVLGEIYASTTVYLDTKPRPCFQHILVHFRRHIIWFEYKIICIFGLTSDVWISISPIN